MRRKILIHYQHCHFLHDLWSQVVKIPYEEENPSDRGASQQFLNQNLFISNYQRKVKIMKEKVIRRKRESCQKEKWKLSDGKVKIIRKKSESYQSMFISNYKQKMFAQRLSRVLFYTETHLSHKPCGTGDEDGLILVESCYWTQTWCLVHLNKHQNL